MFGSCDQESSYATFFDELLKQIVRTVTLHFLALFLITNYIEYLLLLSFFVIPVGCSMT